MQLSAELSLYPLTENYERAVLEFIESLVRDTQLSAVTNSMSTQVHGDAHQVFAAIERALTESYQRFGKQVLVAKFIPDHLIHIPPGD